MAVEISTTLLPPAWYARRTERVARELLGRLLVAGPTVGRIVETEAYHGRDPASHCWRGPTPRCRVMFGPAGVSYVYLCYGLHTMLNLVTEREGYPGAVLIRAVEPVAGQEWMRRRRRGLPVSEWTNGPGRVCRAMGITLAHTGIPLTGDALCVRDDGFKPRGIWKSGRVGIRAGREKPWRFFLRGSPFVSRAPENASARPA